MSAQLEIHELTQMTYLLESPNIHAVQEMKDFVLENLACNKDPTMLNILVETYMSSGSHKCLEILGCVQEPHDKHLLDRATEHMKGGSRLRALDIVGHAVRQHPSWLHKIVTHPFIEQLIKCLRTDTDVPVLMNAVLLITFLIPIVPVSITTKLEDIFDAFQRLACFILSKPGSVAEMYHLHIQVGVYDMFICLYGMYPCLFLTYMRTKFNQMEDRNHKRLFQRSIKPMLERVRMHPCLITSTKEAEISVAHWRQKEVQDIIYDCEKLSLDILGNEFSDKHNNTIAMLSGLNSDVETTVSQYDEGIKKCEFDLDSSATNISVGWSPSEECSLATPPQTPTASKISSAENFFGPDISFNAGSSVEPSNLGSSEAVSDSMVEENINFISNAESVQAIMKQIKRIRYNTMTADVCDYKEFNLQRSSSCPEVQTVGDNVDGSYMLAQYSSSPDSKLSCVRKYTLKSHLYLAKTGENVVLSEPPPRKIKSDGNAANVSSVIGNSVQSSTVTFSSPVTTKGEVSMPKLEESPILPKKDDLAHLKAHNQNSLQPSPAHLLDKYLTLRVQTHKRQLAIAEGSSTSQGLLNLTPAEDVDILKGQVQLLHSQLLYEKHRRELHSKRNRRLLGRIAKTTALEEQNCAMQDQLRLQEEEMQNLKQALQKSRDNCQKFREAREICEREKEKAQKQHYEQMAMLQSLNKDLENKCIKQEQDLSTLNRSLQQQKCIVADQSQQIHRMKLQQSSFPDMAEQMNRLNKELLLMGELQQKYQQRLVAVSATSQPRTEAQFLIESLKAELACNKMTLLQTNHKLEAAHIKTTELDEQLKQKDNAVTDLKKILTDLKGKHTVQLSSVQEKYAAQMRITQAQLEEILTLQSRIHDLQKPHNGIHSIHDNNLTGEEDINREDEDLLATEATEEITNIGYD